MPKSLNEKIADKKKLIEQLENERKQLIQKQKVEERKARTSRLCRRHGALEKAMPDLATITDGQFDDFIRMAINTSYGRDTLKKITLKPTASTTGIPPNSTAGGGTDGSANPPQAASLGV